MAEGAWSRNSFAKMVPDAIPPPPPPPPMPPVGYSSPKPTPGFSKSDTSEKSTCPPKNPLANSDSFDNVINEIKTKGGTLRKTKRKEAVPVEDCAKQIILPKLTTAKPTFKNEIHIVPTVNNKPSNGTTANIKLHTLPLNNGTTINSKLNTLPLNNGTTINSKLITLPLSNGTTSKVNSTQNGSFKLKRPSEFLSDKPEVLKEVSKVATINGNNNISNGTTKPPLLTKKFDTTQQQPSRILVSSTIQRLNSTEPDSPTEARPSSPFKKNQVLRRSSSGGVHETIQKLQSTNGTTSVTPLFQRSESVKQKAIEKFEGTPKPPLFQKPLEKHESTSTKSPLVQRSDLVRQKAIEKLDSTSTTTKPPSFQRSDSVRQKALEKLESTTTSTTTKPPSFQRSDSVRQKALEKLESTTRGSTTTSTPKPPAFQRSNSVRQRISQMNRVDNSNGISDGTRTIGRKAMVPRPNLPIGSRPSGAVRLENDEANVETVVNVSGNGTVSADDPNVKKLVYSTYRNLLGAYNNQANTVVTSQKDSLVVQDRGVRSQVQQITLNGNINGVTGRTNPKTED